MKNFTMPILMSFKHFEQEEEIRRRKHVFVEREKRRFNYVI